MVGGMGKDISNFLGTIGLYCGDFPSIVHDEQGIVGIDVGDIIYALDDQTSASGFKGYGRNAPGRG